MSGLISHEAAEAFPAPMSIDAGRMQAMSDDELREEFRSRVRLTAEHLFRLGCIWVEMERRGMDIEMGLARAQQMSRCSAGSPARMSSRISIAAAARAAGVMRGVPGSWPRDGRRPPPGQGRQRNLNRSA